MERVYRTVPGHSLAMPMTVYLTVVAVLSLWSSGNIICNDRNRPVFKCQTTVNILQTVPYMSLFPVIFAFGITCVTFYCAYTSQMMTVCCTINGPLDKFLLRVLHWIHTILCLLTLFIYLNVWHSTGALTATKRKIIKALIMILSGFTASWIVTSIGSTTMYIIGVKDPYLFIVQYLFIGMSCLCGVWDYVIYFILNVEYRRAFLEQMGLRCYLIKAQRPTVTGEISGWTGSDNIPNTPIEKLTKQDTIKVNISSFKSNP
ncbi:unnamed protein product [Bursaphelenchus okinawaensis]|uniref:G_PROTEIN_RECEP_F1_2 domain-containing protein n=1 Tax=Bursaphelenchus okinawaensis TaxID=465554 RepID=A0A811K5H9_9BILA|nr:unnamed protein product [Bursaphelenchus okinawaensis]CAG9091743.1 unnamed protein product [Bursaphelenchus okinawaensis]